MHFESTLRIACVAATLVSNLSVFFNYQSVVQAKCRSWWCCDDALNVGLWVWALVDQQCLRSEYDLHVWICQRYETHSAIVRTYIGSLIISTTNNCLQCVSTIIQQTDLYVARFSIGWMRVLHAPAHHGSVSTRRLPAVVLFSSLHTAPCMYCMLVFLSTRFVLCKLCSEADTMYEQDTRIMLALVARKASFPICFDAIQGSHGKARCLVNTIRSGIQPDSICCAIS